MRLMIWILTVLALAACNAAPPSLTEADRAAIKEVSDEFTRSFTAGDVPGMLKLYSDDATLMPTGVPAQKGRPAIEAFLLALPKVTEIVLTPEEIDGRGDLAFVRGTYRITMEIPGAPGPVTETGKYVEIWRKQADGKWLVAVNIFNSDLPPPAPPAPSAISPATP